MDIFLKLLKRKYGEIEYIWRLEAQKRGAPHYHLIIYFYHEPDLGKLKKWVSLNWYEVVQRFWEEKDEKHLQAGTNCKKVDNYLSMISYVSKYMTKTDQDKLLDQGRYWGASRNWGDLIASDELNGYEMIKFRRLLRNYPSKVNPYMAKKVRDFPNIEVFVSQRFIIDAYIWSRYGDCDDG